MNNVLSILYSYPFMSGLAIGIVGQRLWCLIKARLMDVRYPLPGGGHRRVGSISPVWVAGLVWVLVIGYVLVQVEQTETHYRTLARDVAECQREFNEALVARSRITTENDQLSRQQRALLAEFNIAESTWIDRLINLPPEIKDLPQSDPRVQTYGQTVTRIYFQRIGRINSEIKSISDRQVQLDQARSDHPLPEPTCGR